MDIKNLSLEEKIGQRFIVGINDKNTSCIIKLIKKKMIGGVVLYKKNYRNYQEMLELIKKFKESNKDNKIPLFIAIDQEGGRVNRLPNEIHVLRNIYDVSHKDNKLVSEYASIIADVLNGTGINMNFAPVLDIYNKSKSKALEKRCFHGNRNNVLEDASMYLEAAGNKIIPVIKHYPGHGSTKKDSHFLAPYVFDYKDVINNHTVPFKKLDNVPAMMVGHLIVRRLSNMLPASISNKFINNYIRDYYDGLIITDEINMIKRWPIYNLIYMNKALKVDSDIILVKIKNEKEFDKIISKYKKIVNINNLDNNVKRIIRVKEKYHVNDNINYNGIDIKSINKRIDELNSLL